MISANRSKQTYAIWVLVPPSGFWHPIAHGLSKRIAKRWYRSHDAITTRIPMLLWPEDLAYPDEMISSWECYWADEVACGRMAYVYSDRFGNPKHEFDATEPGDSRIALPFVPIANLLQNVTHST
jgi:hypothetical protein